MLYVNSGLLAGCHTAGTSWRRQDGAEIKLIWTLCGQQQINLISTAYALARTRSPAAWRHLSVLGADVDLVQRQAGGEVWRYWLQGRLDLTLISVCPGQDMAPCADLTAPAARYLAARLPGRPTVTKATSVVPPASPLVGGLVLLWLLVVGGSRWSKRAKLETFTMPGSQRLHRVDQAADQLRRVSRRRWWAKLLVIVGVMLLAAGAAGIVRQGAAVGASTLVIGLVAGAAGAAMLRGYRHPLLEREHYAAHGGVAEAFRPRKFLSAGATVFLGLLTLLTPLAVLAGWILAGLTSDEQDLSSILAGLVFAAVVAGYFIDRAAQRLRARNLQDAMKRDPERSMLYLRNFGDDDQKILTSRFNRRGVWQRVTGCLNPIGTARFEEVLTRALAHSGPIIAIGQPGGKLRNLFSAIAPTLGAARTTLTHEDWKGWVVKNSKEVHAVVVSATPAQVNPGFAWELLTLASDVGHGRIVLVFGTGPKAELHRRFGAFIGAVHRYPLFAELASGWVTDGTLILVHDPAQGWGTWQGWGADRRTAWTYTAAVGAAMDYAQQAWARPPAKLIPPPAGPSTLIGQGPGTVS